MGGMGRASRGWWWSAALLGACQPFSGGVGTSGANTLGVPDDGDEATAGSTDTPSTDEAGTTGLETAGMDPSGPADVTTAGPADDGTTTDEPPPATTGMGAALLTISDGPQYDFGDVPTGGQASHVFTVTNDGDAEATGLGGMVAAPFGFPGGFPGSAGSCGNELGAGQSCTVEVTFSPGALIGLHAGTLTIGHDGPDALRGLQGGAAGQTGNLLTNPGGESGGTPPPGWSVAQGQWIAGAVLEEVSPAQGTGYLYSDTGPNNADYVLRQDVDVGAWALTIDQGALQFSFSGQGRGWVEGLGDEHRIRVHYLDAGGGTLQVWTTNYQAITEWQGYSDSRLAPASTRTVRVELNCRKLSGTWCNAYFDALDLHASYP
jgi:hypothetical protein